MTAKVGFRIVLFAIVAWIIIDYMVASTARKQSNSIALAGYARSLLGNHALITNRALTEYFHVYGRLPEAGETEFCPNGLFCVEFIDDGVYLIEERGHGIIVHVHDILTGREGFDCFVSLPWLNTSGPPPMPECEVRDRDWFAEWGVVIQGVN